LPWSELQETSDPELVRQLISGNDDALAVLVGIVLLILFFPQAIASVLAG
jgi:hypothetical protein